MRYYSLEHSTPSSSTKDFPLPPSLESYGSMRERDQIGKWLSGKLQSCDDATKERVWRAYINGGTIPQTTSKKHTDAYKDSHNRFNPESRDSRQCPPHVSLPDKALMHIMPAVALNADDKFTLLESIIKACHVCEDKSPSYSYSDPMRHSYTRTFDNWNAEKDTLRQQIRTLVVDYYNKLDFVKRYGLGCFAWIKDADIQALLQILQARGRAKAAVRLDKFELELAAISDKIAKLESGGRYYREDRITLSCKFDKLSFEIQVYNDRPKKRQERIEKIAAAPGKAVAAAAEGTLKAADTAFNVGCLIMVLIGIILVPIMLVLHLFGVVK